MRPDGRKVKGTIHWVSAAHAVPAEVRLYDRLFTKPNPDDAPEGQDFLANLNPNSLEVLDGCWVEPSLARPPARRHLPVRAAGLLLRGPRLVHGTLVFNRAVSLKDEWARIARPRLAIGTRDPGTKRDGEMADAASGFWRSLVRRLPTREDSKVVLDRRHGERRRHAEVVDVDRRREDRRQPVTNDLGDVSVSWEKALLSTDISVLAVPFAWTVALRGISFTGKSSLSVSADRSMRRFRSRSCRCGERCTGTSRRDGGQN